MNLPTGTATKVTNLFQMAFALLLMLAVHVYWDTTAVRVAGERPTPELHLCPCQPVPRSRHLYYGDVSRLTDASSAWWREGSPSSRLLTNHYLLSVGLNFIIKHGLTFDPRPWRGQRASPRPDLIADFFRVNRLVVIALAIKNLRAQEGYWSRVSMLASLQDVVNARGIYSQSRFLFSVSSLPFQMFIFSTLIPLQMNKKKNNGRWRWKALNP